MNSSDASNTTPPPLPPDRRPDPPPRAFAQGVGILLQTVGIVLFLSSCCVCSVAGIWDPLPSRGQTADMYREQRLPDLSPGKLFDEPGKAGVMLNVMFTTVGGLALASFGLGLQSDRRRAAMGALLSSTALLLVLAVSGVAMWLGGAGWGWRIWNALLLVVMVVLVGFCLAALRQVLRHPPPAEPETVTDEDIARFKLH